MGSARWLSGWGWDARYDNNTSLKVKVCGLDIDGW